MSTERPVETKGDGVCVERHSPTRSPDLPAGRNAPRLIDATHVANQCRLGLLEAETLAMLQLHKCTPGGG
jgi:hypothetical protein